MFHLFKEVYLERDNKINSKFSHIVISSENGYPAGSLSKQFQYAQSIEEIVGDGKQYANIVEMFSALGNKADETGTFVYIYADRDNYVKIAALWLKLIFQNSNAEAAYNYIKCWTSKYNIKYLNRSGTDDERLILLGKNEFVSEYENISEDFSYADSFVRSIAQYLSMEILTASYLANKSVADIFTPRLIANQNHAFASFMQDVKKDIMYAGLRQAVKDVSTIGDYSVENLENMVNDPALDNFYQIYEVVNDNYVNNTNDWSNLPSDEDIEKTRQMILDLTTSIYVIENPTCVNRLTILPIFKNSIDSAAIDTILDYEIVRNPTYSFAEPSNIGMSFNTFFMDLILDPIRNSIINSTPLDRSYLDAYIIRGYA
jgi:hypothetical protein